MEQPSEETKTTKRVQIDFEPSGSVTVSYFNGSKQLGKPHSWRSLPKRLEFFWKELQLAEAKNR